MSQTSQTSQTSDTVADLAALNHLVTELQGRVQRLEAQAEQWHTEVSEDVLVAISAACAAYLGKRATIKQVHRGRGGAWASQGRAAVQLSHADLRGHAMTGTPDRRTFDGGRQ